MITVKLLLTHQTQRKDTEQGWHTLNPILLSGEIGIEIDTRRVKVGDGIHNWIDLPYWTTYGTTYIGSESNVEHGGIYVLNNVISADLLYEEITPEE